MYKQSRRSNVKKKYTACTDLLEKAENDFIGKFEKCEIYLIRQKSAITTAVGKDLMVKVYTYRMVSAEQPGRTYYDKIRMSARFGKCPYCSLREADTVDHYLPKAKYPIFAVTPITLVPCCTPCQDKTIPYPKSDEEQTLHPYFDNVEKDNWITAIVHKTNPITFSYQVNPPAHWTNILKKRVKNHFESYNLQGLFSAHANEEFRGRKLQMLNLYNSDPLLLKQYIEESYNSYLELGVNSWQAVMYEALLNNTWFSDIGILCYS